MLRRVNFLRGPLGLLTAPKYPRHPFPQVGLQHLIHTKLCCLGYDLPRVCRAPISPLATNATLAAQDAQVSGPPDSKHNCTNILIGLLKADGSILQNQNTNILSCCFIHSALCVPAGDPHLLLGYLKFRPDLPFLLVRIYLTSSTNPFMTVTLNILTVATVILMQHDLHIPFGHLIHLLLLGRPFHPGNLGKLRCRIF